METPRIVKGRSAKARLKEYQRLFGAFRYTLIGKGRIRIHGDWEQKNMVLRKNVPIIGKVYFNKRHVDVLVSVLRDIEEGGDADLIDLADYRRSGGTFVPRCICWNPKNPPSPHAWGIAIDINVSKNPYGGGVSRENRKLTTYFEKWGFAWGGRWSAKHRDGMHWEVSGQLAEGVWTLPDEPTSPPDLAVVIDKDGVEKRLKCDPQWDPNHRTVLAQVRAVARACGAQVQWRGADQTVVLRVK